MVDAFDSGEQQLSELWTHLLFVFDLPSPQNDVVTHIVIKERVCGGMWWKGCCGARLKYPIVMVVRGQGGENRVLTRTYNITSVGQQYNSTVVDRQR